MAVPRIYTAVINESSSGDQEIVAAVAGKSIHVLHYAFTVASALTVTWKSASTAISGPMSLTAGINSAGGFATDGGFVIPLMKTAGGEALNAGLGGAVAMGGHITYTLLDA